MLFNSILFLGFFSLVYLIYWNLTGRSKSFWLVFTSIAFYSVWGLEREGLWGLRWAGHFLFMVSLTYFLIRRMMASELHKKRWISVIIVVNLLNLGIFKYFGFMRAFLTDVGLTLPAPVMEYSIFLPLAISFYTFQIIAYAVDVYRGQIKKDEGFFRFAFFILFFPQLIAGPIMRASDFMEQMEKPSLTKERLYDGIWLIMGGLTKKVLLADPMGKVLAPVYREPMNYSSWSIMAAGMCFSLQVYCDFSGYTDIARGCARLLGYEIPENFRAPFFSRNARELWARWHITMSTWLRDYIYFPLGGNRVGPIRTYVNLAITFTLGGLWHGADYTYICWGGMWGVLLAVERFVEDKLGWKTTPTKNRVFIGAKIFLMFTLFSIGALMFRSQPVQYSPAAADFHTSGWIMAEVFKGLFTNLPWDISNLYAAAGGDAVGANMIFGEKVLRLNEIKPVETIVFMFILLFGFHWIQYASPKFERLRKYDFWVLLGVGAILGGVLMPSMAVAGAKFIYFVF